jgi:hypothetical protein
MSHLSTIRAFQSILTTYRFGEAASFPEEFAIKRFLKKMEVPDVKLADERKQRCFRDWADFDASLKIPHLLPGNWYKARQTMHQWCTSFRLAPVVFTNGSEATSTRGLNSLESKLMRSRWECTPDCFDLWAETAYETLAIKRAVRSRFAAFMKHEAVAIRAFHRESYRRFSALPHPERVRMCFKRTLACVTAVREASRFSSVRKNNEKDRPIDLQPLCNMLVQRRVGNGFRNLLRDQGVDLDNLATEHRSRIRNRGVATIDLKNASDSIHIDLVRFMLPKRVFDFISRSRTCFTEGLDGQYYLTNKVSSMGNGFTFELMTVILRALGLQHDNSFSVFGDDIIVVNEQAEALIEDLTSVGFLVNDDKSFIRSPFRESCGGNYHDDFGYIESYDFEYPLSIHDCVVLNNKAYALALKYPQFKKLSALLLRAVPPALHGPAHVLPDVGDGRQGYNQQIKLSATFWSSRPGGESWSDDHVRRVLLSLHLHPPAFKLVKGFKWVPKNASKRVDVIAMRRHTGKYFMYLHANRRTDDVIEGCGSWQEVAFLSDGRSLLRFKALREIELLPA